MKFHLLSKKTKQLKKTQIVNICKLKNIHWNYGFKSNLESKDFADQLIKKNKILSNNKYFVISTTRYINMLIFKTLDELKK